MLRTLRGRFLALAITLGIVGLVGLGRDTYQRVFEPTIEEFYAYTYRPMVNGSLNARLVRLHPGEKQTCTDLDNGTRACSYTREVSYFSTHTVQAGLWTLLIASSASVFVSGLWLATRARRSGSAFMLASAGALVAWAALFYWGNPWGSYVAFVVFSVMLAFAALVASVSFLLSRQPTSG